MAGACLPVKVINILSKPAAPCPSKSIITLTQVYTPPPTPPSSPLSVKERTLKPFIGSVLVLWERC